MLVFVCVCTSDDDVILPPALLIECVGSDGLVDAAELLGGWALDPMWQGELDLGVLYVCGWNVTHTNKDMIVCYI